MSKREAIARYNLIIKRVRKSNCTFQEICDYLELESELQAYNFVVSKRTFQRDLKDIESLFNIEIKYDASLQAYRIVEEPSPDISNRMLEAFDTFNALNVSDSLSNHIHFEDRKPLGTEHFYGLLHAIKNRYQIEFHYKKYWDDSVSMRKAYPYALKEYRHRWYVVAKDLKDHKIKTFSLDRIVYLYITKQIFRADNNFDVKNYFHDCFGIIRGDDQPAQKVVLRFSAFQGKYIQSLPLHHTQKPIKKDKESYTIELKLRITHDFIMELMSMGSEVKVLEPESLATDIKNKLEETHKKYN